MFFNNLKPLFEFISTKKLLVLFLITLFGLIIEIFSLAILFPVINFITGDGESKYEKLISETLSLESGETLIYVVVFLFLVYMLRLIYMTYLNWNQNIFLQKLNAKIINKLYSNYLNQKYTDTILKDSSVYLKNIQVEMTTFSSGITAAFFLIIEVATILATFFVLLFFDTINTLIVTIYMFIIMYVFFKLFKRKISNLGEERKIVTENISFVLNNSLSGLKEIIVNDVQPYFINPFKLLTKKQVRIISTIGTLNFLPRFVLEFVAVGAICILVVIYSILGKLDSVIPLIAVFSVAGFRLIPSFNRIVTYVQQYRYSNSSFELIFQDIKISNSEQISNKIINDEKFSILDLNNITVRYPNSEENVIKNLSLTIESGKSIGIFGESGSGKSTLLDRIVMMPIF